jgi:hypothetical protein
MFIYIYIYPGHVQKFPHISEAKEKEGIYVGPQIKELIRDNAFRTALNHYKKNTMECL